MRGPAVSELLERIECYYDAVPRRFARVEECGPFTLFLGEPGGWVYYARPRLGLTDEVDAVEVAAATARLLELGLPGAVEWVQETTPSLLGAVREEGSLTVEELPLLVLDADAPLESTPLPDGVRVRLLGPEDGAALAAARAVSEVGFAAGGTAAGEAGPAERDARLRHPQQRVLDLLADGAVRMAVAESDEAGVLATGRIQPVEDVTEVMGVATLPAARRQGLAAGVTAALVGDARRSGVSTVFLTASSADVARVYERVGFRRVATGFAAEVMG